MKSSRLLNVNRISFIRHINRPFREKLVLSFLMSAGLFAMAAGITKTVMYGGFTANVDYFYKLSYVGLWLYVLVSFGKLAAYPHL
jgi:hypothetical protein